MGEKFYTTIIDEGSQASTHDAKSLSPSLAKLVSPTPPGFNFSSSQQSNPGSGKQFLAFNPHVHNLHRHNCLSNSIIAPPNSTRRRYQTGAHKPAPDAYSTVFFSSLELYDDLPTFLPISARLLSTYFLRIPVPKPRGLDPTPLRERARLCP